VAVARTAARCSCCAAAIALLSTWLGCISFITSDSTAAAPEAAASAGCYRIACPPLKTAADGNTKFTSVGYRFRRSTLVYVRTVEMFIRCQVGLSVAMLQMGVWAASDEMVCSALLCSAGMDAGLLPMAVTYAAVET
jgi:hypothetical protein